MIARKMNLKSNISAKCPALKFALAATVALTLSCQAADTPKDKAPDTNLVPLEIKLPAPAFKGTPKDIQLSTYVEPLSDKPRPAMMVPAGLKNLAPASKLTSSDKNANEE